jgi:iron complex outermembrane receptor protein
MARLSLGCWITLVATLLGLAAPAFAQNPAAEGSPGDAAGSALEEVIVTARRKSEDLQSVPVSVSVVSQDEIDRRGNVTVADLEQIVPGLQVSAGNARSDANITIRGQSQSPTTLAPAVITYFDEVALPRIAEGAFFDLENIQVLKGPQGTLFGRVTDGGAVLLTSKRPTDQFEGYADETVGDYGLDRFQGAVNLPLGDKVSLRIATSIVRRDGYTRNLFNGTDMDNVNTDDARVSLLIKPTPELENYTIYAYGHSDENCCGSVVVGLNPLDMSPAYYAQELAIYNAQRARGPYVVDEGVAGYYRDGMYYTRNASWLVNRTTWSPGDQLSVKNIFGFTYDRELTGSVIDGATVPTGAAIGVPGVPIPSDYRDQVSDELQMQGAAFDSRLTYTAGLYWEHQYTPGPTDQYVDQLGGIVQVSLVQRVDTESRAAYGQLSYDLKDVLEGLKLDVGARYSADKVRSDQAEYILIGEYPVPPNNLPLGGQCLSAEELAADYPGAIPHPACGDYRESSHAPTYTLGLDYQINHDLFAYASLRRGYRPGGVNAGAGGSIGAEYGPEFDLSRELGIKADWHLGSMQGRTNLTGFWDTTDHLQQLVASFSGAPVSGVVNSGIAQVRGVEFESTLIPIRGVELRATWAYLDGYFERNYSASAIDAACPANPYTTPPAANGILCPLLDISSMPRNVVSLAAHYTLPLVPSIGAVSLGGNWYSTTENAPGGIDSRQFPTTLAPLGGHVPGYNLLNLDASWNSILSRPLDIAATVTNVTNRAYIQSMSDYLDASSIGVEAAYYGPPRMFSVSFRYHFGGR